MLREYIYIHMPSNYSSMSMVYSFHDGVHENALFMIDIIGALSLSSQ